MTKEEIMKALGTTKFGAWQPVAYYDQDTNYINFQIRDASITETYISAGLVIYEDNHPKPSQSKIIGFSIRYSDFFKSLGIKKGGKIRLAEIMYKFSKYMENKASAKEACIFELVYEKFIDFLKESEIEVDFDE